MARADKMVRKQSLIVGMVLDDIVNGRLRLDYWANRHHIGKKGYYGLSFILLLFTDRRALKEAMVRKIPKLKRLWR